LGAGAARASREEMEEREDADDVRLGVVTGVAEMRLVVEVYGVDIVEGDKL